jgi:hypothetical protein
VVRCYALPLLTFAGLMIDSSSTAARSPSADRLGVTSTTSITISVSVRPQVQLSRVDAPEKLRGSLTVASHPPQPVCLLASKASGDLAVLIQSSDGQTSDEQFVRLDADEAATSTCRSLVENLQARTTAGYHLPPTFEAQPASYTLLIAPE